MKTCVSIRGAELQGANLGSVYLENAKLQGADLEGSFWYKNDINKFFHILEEANFTYITIEEDDEQKEVNRMELFPDVK